MQRVKKDAMKEYKEKTKSLRAEKWKEMKDEL